MPRQLIRPAAAGLAGILYGLSFPPYNLHFLAWVCLVPLLYCSSSSLNNFSFGLLAGFIANLIVFSWLWKTFLAAGVNVPTTLSAWSALSFVLALYFGVFNLFHSLLPNRWFKPWISAAVWVGFEFIRSIILTGFPWALLAHSQVNNLLVLQLAFWTGTAGISYLIILVNLSLAFCLSTKSFRPFIPTLLVLLLVYGTGWYRLSHAPTPTRHMKVALLQGNIDQYQKWDSAYEKNIRDTYEYLALKTAQEKPDVIVWPESAVPAWFPQNKVYYEWMKNLVKQTKTAHVVGAVTQNDGGYFNAAFFMTADGRIVGEYDKRHLVPFGEYIPFGGFLRRWIPYLGELGTFSAGKNPQTFDTDSFKLAPNICYEAAFPRLVKESVNNCADVIVNITNDGWYLDTGAPEQHYVMNVFRAVENHRPVVRAANTGISAVIDAYGRPLAKTPLMAKTILVWDVPLVTP